MNLSLPSFSMLKSPSHRVAALTWSIAFAMTFFWHGQAWAEDSDKSIASKHFVVGSSAIVEHPSLDKIRDGAKAGLAKAGFIDGQNITFIYQTAQNRQPTQVQITRKFVGDKVDLLIPIGTAAAQAAVNATHTIPVIFSGVTDPVTAGLMKDPEHPQKNVTGVSDILAIDKHVVFIKELLPHLKNLGFIYNPGEPNSAIILKKLQQETAKQNIHLVIAPAIQTAQVRSATLSIINKVDAIYISTDNTVVSALETAVRVAKENKIPIITADTQSVERGALAAFGTDYFHLGEITGQMAAKVLRGEKIADLPMQHSDPTDLVINQITAEQIGYHFPQSILDRATRIIK